MIYAHREDFTINENDAFQSADFKRLLMLIDELKTKYGFVCGDINLGGIFRKIGRLMERFFSFIQSHTGTNSISVNRTNRYNEKPVYLHSECSHTMISEDDYREFLMPIDAEWSRKYRPYGIHYCGKDPHRNATAYGELPFLDFFNLGWGGDIAVMRQHLPDT